MHRLPTTEPAADPYGQTISSTSPSLYATSRGTNHLSHIPASPSRWHQPGPILAPLDCASGIETRTSSLPCFDTVVDQEPCMMRGEELEDMVAGSQCATFSKGVSGDVQRIDHCQLRSSPRLPQSTIDYDPLLPQQFHNHSVPSTAHDIAHENSCVSRTPRLRVSRPPDGEARWVRQSPLRTTLERASHSSEISSQAKDTGNSDRQERLSSGPASRDWTEVLEAARRQVRPRDVIDEYGHVVPNARVRRM